MFAARRQATSLAPDPVRFRADAPGAAGGGEDRELDGVDRVVALAHEGSGESQRRTRAAFPAARPLRDRHPHVHLELQHGGQDVLVDVRTEIGHFVVHDLPEREELHLDEAEGVAVGFAGGDRPVFVHHRRIEAVHLAGVDLAPDGLHDGIGVAGRVVHPRGGGAEGVKVDLDSHGCNVRPATLHPDLHFRPAVWHLLHFTLLHGDSIPNSARFWTRGLELPPSLEGTPPLPTMGGFLSH